MAYKVALGSLGELLLGSISQVRIYWRLAHIRLDRQRIEHHPSAGKGEENLPGESEFASTWFISELDILA